MNGIDYVGLVNKTIKFKPNESMAKEISITIINEKLVENNETFSVMLTSESSPMLVVKDPNITVVTIDNDDGKMFFQFCLSINQGVSISCQIN